MPLLELKEIVLASFFSSNMSIPRLVALLPKILSLTDLLKFSYPFK